MNRSTLKKVALTALLLSFLGSIATFGTNAVFTDTDNNTGNLFTAGTVAISTSPVSAFLTLDPMAPGDKVTAPLTVSNDGSLELRYALSSTTTEAVLAAALDLTVKSGVTTCTDAGFGTDGTVLYGPLDLGSTGGTAIFGNPIQGIHAGDRVVAASSSEVLCFQAELPLATTDASQGLTTTATFTFDAEQTINNP